MRLNVEGIARNVDPNREITVVGWEDALLTMKSEETTTAKSEVHTIKETQKEDTEDGTNSEDVNWMRNSRGRSRGRFRGRGGLFHQSVRKRNCYIRDDPTHFARYCPLNPKRARNENKGSTVTGFVTENNSNLSEGDSNDGVFFANNKKAKTETPYGRDNNWHRGIQIDHFRGSPWESVGWLWGISKRMG